jgi:hypothetical protein
MLAAHMNGKSVITSVRSRGYVFTGFDLIAMDRTPAPQGLAHAAAGEDGNTRPV